jgi:hypothetical protein
MPEQNGVSIGDRAVELAVQANPNISPEVQGLLKKGAEKDVAVLLERMKSGDLKLGDGATCGIVTELFKDKADNKYAGVAMIFDRQGNMLRAEGMAAGSLEVQAVLEKTKVDPGTAQEISEGFRRVPMTAGLPASVCKPG